MIYGGNDTADCRTGRGFQRNRRQGIEPQRTDQSGGSREYLPAGRRDGLCAERTETFQNSERSAGKDWSCHPACQIFLYAGSEQRD